METTVHPIHALNEGRIGRHLEMFLGKPDGVMHDLIGGSHVYIYPANAKRAFQTLVTMGLSGFAMPVPDNQDNHEELRHAELFTYLPAGWPMPSVSRGPGYWPYAMLTSLVSYAAEANAWLGPLHTVPNLTSEPPGQPFEKDSLLSHCLLLPPVKENNDFDSLTINGNRVRFLHVLPITGAEYDASISKGFFDSLADLLDSGSIPIVINPCRRSAV